MTNFLVFTDLDGTLLDHHSYSYEEAMPAVRALVEAGSPLIFNSSKTAAEIKQLRHEMVVSCERSREIRRKGVVC